MLNCNPISTNVHINVRDLPSLPLNRGVSFRLYTHEQTGLRTFFSALNQTRNRSRRSGKTIRDGVSMPDSCYLHAFIIQTVPSSTSLIVVCSTWSVTVNHSNLENVLSSIIKCHKSYRHNRFDKLPLQIKLS